MEYKIANNHEEWSQAFKLLKKRFEGSGIIDYSDKLYYFPGYFALPTTTVFVAKEGNTVVATTVTVFDNDYLGLPAETVYKTEVDSLRLLGKVAEGGSIATNSRLSLKQSLVALFNIIRLSFIYFDRQGYTQGIITAHPRHNKYYCDTWGGVLLGDEKIYPNRNNRLVQAYWCTKQLMQAKAPKTYHKVFETEVETDLTPVVIPTDLVHHYLTTTT